MWPSWEDNKLFTVLLAILMVYGIVFLLVQTQRTYKEAQRAGYADQTAPTISVTGEGNASAASDLREVDLTVREEGTTANAAQDANAESMNGIIAAMKELGIESKDLQTSSYNVSPRYDYDASPAKIVGYEAMSTLTVTIRDAELVSSVLTIAGDKGVEYIGDVRFSIEDTTEMENEAREEALQEARAQAESIADAMGAELGRVVSYYESSGSAYPYYMERSLAAADSAIGSAPDIEEGENEVSLSVTVTYALE